MTEYFARLARAVESSVVDLPSLRRSGLVWETGLVLTARTEPKFPAAATLSTPTGNVGVITVAGGPHLPIAALRTSPMEGLRPPRRKPASQLDHGAWILALWRRDRQVSFTPAHFLGTLPVSCGGQTVDELASNVAWTREMAGGGVFDLDQNLLAVIVPCLQRFAAVTAEGVTALLREGQSLQGRLLGRFGFGVEPLTEAEQRFFDRYDGLLVREVWTESLAEMSGLTPGDILVGIDNVPITRTDQLEHVAAITEVGAFDFAVSRRGELLDVRLATGMSVVEGPAVPPAVDGLVWESPTGGLVINRVAPGSRADDAGIRGGDRLLRIDGIDIEDADQVRAVLAPEREHPVFVELKRDERRWGVLLP